jgi:protein pelota
MLRSASAEERTELDNLLRNTEKMKGKVMIFSAENEPGEELTSLGGIAALLRFKIS